MKPALTHLALLARDLDRSIDFYRKHVDLRVVHDRVDGGRRVVWLGEREGADFVLVLLEAQGGAAPGLAPGPAPGPGTLQHLGFALGSREEVDRAAAAARADGVLSREPSYAGPIVGYFCVLDDPDGNGVELSYGQPINPRDLPPR